MTAPDDVTSNTPVVLDDVAYYLERIRQECLSATNAQNLEIARIHLNFAAHYLRTIASSVEQGHAGASGV